MNKQLSENTVATVGSFDGVHSGHRVLLQRVVDLASQHCLQSVVITFWPHPRQVIDPPGTAPLLLNTLDERINMLKRTGVEDVIVLPFDTTFSQMHPTVFIVEIILKKLNAKYMVVGQDHHFGKERSGNVQQLSDFFAKSSLHIDVVNLKKLNNKISSSSIRKALLRGDLALANEMLGYNYMISGKVITGNQLGRSIGFPTANIETPEYKLLPKEGVYRVIVKYKTETHTGMLYIGKRPVSKQNDETTHVEVNIFDFDRQIYGQELIVELTHRIRDNINFDNVTQLSEQLLRDKQTVLEI